MTGNRLIERRPAAGERLNATDHCPDGYSNPHAWCAWRNSQKTREEIMWVVGPNGTPICVDDPGVCARLGRENKRRLDEEARRHNWRVMHPMDEQAEAAE